jgi:hypothetical protein
MDVDSESSTGPPTQTELAARREEEEEERNHSEAETSTVIPLAVLLPENQLVPMEPPLSPPSLDMLPLELLPDIFLYLDSPRDVLNLGLCSKTLYDAVTPTVAIRAIVFQGDKRTT